MSTRRLRSILYIPGHKLEWMRKAPSLGADALLLDLEDAVSEDMKATARAAVRTALEELASALPLLYVRVNGWGTGHTLDDLLATVHRGLDGVALPKADTPADIHALDKILDELEHSRGLPPGAIEIMPMPETARGMMHHYELLSASNRCRRACGVAGSAPKGDYYRALGSQWTEEGIETLFSNCHAVMSARAAGIDSIICGPVSRLDDLDYVREVFTRAKTLGANGCMVISPAHIAAANEVFSPSQEELDAAQSILHTMVDAIARGNGAAKHQGTMIDVAMIRSSLDVLEFARSVGLRVEDHPSAEQLGLR